MTKRRPRGSSWGTRRQDQGRHGRRPVAGSPRPDLPHRSPPPGPEPRIGLRQAVRWPATKVPLPRPRSPRRPVQGRSRRARRCGTNAGRQRRRRGATARLRARPGVGAPSPIRPGSRRRLNGGRQRCLVPSSFRSPAAPRTTRAPRDRLPAESPRSQRHEPLRRCSRGRIRTWRPIPVWSDTGRTPAARPRSPAPCLEGWRSRCRRRFRGATARSRWPTATARFRRRGLRR